MKTIGSSMMTDPTSQNDALEALQALNTAITTARLYPADAPQIPATVEKAYQAIKHHLRNNGDLVFSLENEEQMLCGSPIQRQTLGKRHGADIFQHLKLLGLPYTVIRPGFDRKTFKQLLTFFTTAPQKIRKEGGGAVYAAQLGLRDIFPAHYAMVQAQDDPAQMLLALASSVPDIKGEWIDYLTGRNTDEPTGLEVRTLFTDPGKAARTLSAGIAMSLREIRGQETAGLSRSFEKVLEQGDELLDQTQKGEVALKTALVLLKKLKGPALGVLFSQSYPGKFGEALFASLTARIDHDDLRGVVAYLREREIGSDAAFGPDSDQSQIVRNTLSRLLDTTKGKQFQALEKARAIMESGEKERRSKRLRSGLNAIIRGNTSILQNAEIVSHLPQTVEQLLANGKHKAAALLIERLTKELMRGDEKIQPQLNRCIGRIGQILVDSKKWDWLDTLAGPLLVMVKEMDEDASVYEKIVTVLQHVMLHGWRVGNYKKADQIVSMFFMIRSGMLAKSPPLRALTAKIQDQFIDRTLLPLFLSQYLASPGDVALAQRLTLQGPIAARFLIVALLASENAGERIKILDLLTHMGPLLPPVLIEQLPEPMPWFGKRNLLKLLAETGNEEHMEAVFSYLGHDDLRVQREALGCLYKISGRNRKDTLVRALTLASETMKIQVVKALVPLVDDDVALVLADLLAEQNHFSPETREMLIKQICLALAQSSSKHAAETIEKFLALRGKGRTRRFDPSVWKSAEDALELIEINQQKLQRPAPETHVEVPAPATEFFPGRAGKVRERITGFPEEQQIKGFLEMNERGKAKELLLELIDKTARLKQFDQAEQLRDWLIQIDPTSLTEIIRAAGIIENEKTSSIDKDLLETWFSLYDVLTTEEFNALHYSLEHKKYSAEEMLVKQGEIKPSLFFINKGKVKLFFVEHDSEVLVKIAGRGEVVGAASFFDASVWTISVAALGYAEVSELAIDKTKNWQRDHPALESKFHDYCMHFDGLKDYLLKRGKDRRDEHRVPISGRIDVIFLDRNGKDTGISSKGDLTDISAGGTSFFIHISQKKNARFLLGRNVRLVFPSQSAEAGKTVDVDGTIVAVRSHRVVGNEYSAHVSFDTPLAKKELKRVVEAGK